MGKLSNFWKTILAGGAGVAALAAVNASIQRNAHDPDDTLHSVAQQNFSPGDMDESLYKELGSRIQAYQSFFVHGIGAGSPMLHVAEKL